LNIVVDANVAIAALDPDHGFHRAALRACLSADDVAIVNITRAESLIHPTRMGRFDEADAELDRLGFVTFAPDDGVADRARRLRASCGNRHFPMIDASSLRSASSTTASSSLPTDDGPRSPRPASRSSAPTDTQRDGPPTRPVTRSPAQCVGERGTDVLSLNRR